MNGTWAPLLSFTVFVIILAFGDWIALKSKAMLSIMFVSSVVHLLGYWTGVIPTDSIANTGLILILNNFALPLMIANLGTMINMDELLREWKTVVIALSSLVFLAAACFLIGIPLFGRHYALAASAPIAGGGIAGILISNACNEAGYPVLGGYAMLVTGLQFLIGMPGASILLKPEMNRLLKKGAFDTRDALTKDSKIKPVDFRVIKNMGPWFSRPMMMLAKLSIVAYFAMFIANLTVIPGSNPTNYILNPSIAYLLFGIVFAQLGFLEKDLLKRSGYFGVLLVAQLAQVPNSLAKVTFPEFINMAVPTVGMLVLGAIALAVGGVIVGRLLGYDMRVSAALALCAMCGYPATQIITEEICEALDATQEQKENAVAYLLPKMMVSGFTTVTIASVAFAGMVAPLIFK